VKAVTNHIGQMKIVEYSEILKVLKERE